jgi:hypothetical protein
MRKTCVLIPFFLQKRREKVGNKRMFCGAASLVLPVSPGFSLKFENIPINKYA